MTAPSYDRYLDRLHDRAYGEDEPEPDEPEDEDEDELALRDENVEFGGIEIKDVKE